MRRCWSRPSRRFGLPGWAAFEARATLAQLTATPPLDSVLVVLAFLTLPTYLRLLGGGHRVADEPRGPGGAGADRPPAGGAPRRSRSSARRPTGRRCPPRPSSTAPHRTPAHRVARHSGDMASKGAVSVGRRFTRALRRDATELTAAAVLTLAVLAAFTAWGVLDIGGAASEPAPITTNAASD